MTQKKTSVRKGAGDRMLADRFIKDGIGEKIRLRRIELKLTQEQLAAQCQVRGLSLTRGTLAKIEAQIRGIKASELFIIAKVLSISMERFYPPGFGEP
jgi:transcriptional regulator with XRE-family HTH domain